MKRKGEGELIEPGAARPPAAFRSERRRTSWALTALAILATLAAIRLAKPVLVPVVAAVLLKVALEPVMSAARRLRVPAPIAAVVVILALCGGIGFAAVRFSEPVASWMQELPASIDRVEEKLDRLRRPLEQISDVANRVEDVAGGQGTDAKPVQVEVAGRESLFRQIVTEFSTGVIQLATTLALLLLLLASDGAFVHKLIELAGTRKDRALVVRAVSEIESQVARYLGTVILVNTGLGLAIGISFALVGMPNAALWGTAAGLLSFIPYVGGAVGLMLATWVSMLTFDTLGAALVPPAIYMAVDACEGLVLSPWIMGKRLEMSPVVMFVWLALWGWMWGIPGAFMAVPMLAVLRIVADHVPGLAVWSSFLGKWSAPTAIPVPAPPAAEGAST